MERVLVLWKASHCMDGEGDEVEKIWDWDWDLCVRFRLPPWWREGRLTIRVPKWLSRSCVLGEVWSCVIEEEGEYTWR